LRSQLGEDEAIELICKENPKKAKPLATPRLQGFYREFASIAQSLTSAKLRPVYASALRANFDRANLKKAKSLTKPQFQRLIDKTIRIFESFASTEFWLVDRLLTPLTLISVTVSPVFWNGDFDESRPIGTSGSPNYHFDVAAGGSIPDCYRQ
jgi:hypothetical protein